jgi:hypothetical protein
MDVKMNAKIDAKDMKFRKDGTFRVLQLADVQDGPVVSEDSIKLIRAAIREADPDLVVLTGDQIRGYDPAYTATYLSRRDSVRGEGVLRNTVIEARLTGKHVELHPTDPAAAIESTRRKVASSMAQFLAPIIEKGIPFAATYGNHDFQCGLLADEQDDMYRAFPGCLNPVSATATDGSGTESADGLACEPGTFALAVRSSDGSRRALGITLINSGDYAETGGYGCASSRALAWLETLQQKLSRGQSETVPSIAFQHIPVPEYYRCLRKVSAFTPHALEGHRRFSDACWVLDPQVCWPGSVMGEAPCCSDNNVGELQTLQRQGFFALFSGHDHKNTFIGTVDSFDMGYTPTCGFTSYGPSSRDRALRLFTFHENDVCHYDTRLLTFGNLVALRSSDEVKIFAGKHMISSPATVRNDLRKPSVFSVLAAGVVALARATTHYWLPARAARRNARLL